MVVSLMSVVGRAATISYFRWLAPAMAVAIAVFISVVVL